jgi:hypothetical protein
VRDENDSDVGEVLPGVTRSKRMMTGDAVGWQDDDKRSVRLAGG